MAPLSEFDFKRFFTASMGKILILRPGDFEILAATDAYLKATLTEEQDIVGKRLFEVFPDDPSEHQADGTLNLRSSLLRVQALKIPDTMGIQRYPIPLPDGTFEERFWSPVNSPIFNELGELDFIMHRVEDVTALLQDSVVSDLCSGVKSTDHGLLQEVVSRSKELKKALMKLQEQEARMRTAERLLKLGTWEYNLQTTQMSWSSQVFDIYDVSVEHNAPDISGFFELIHPQDRDAARRRYMAFTDKQADLMQFEHRIITRDGNIRHIKGAGERHLSAGGEIVVGYVQDITAMIQTRDKLSQAEQLLKLAGEKALVGGWRVDLSSGETLWTSETAAIHHLPANYSPKSVQEAIEYYAPEYREVIRKAFEQCAGKGESFDVICQLQINNDASPWVRAIGVAERDSKGRIIVVQGAFQDITTLHEAQIRADIAEQQKLHVLESMSDAVFALDEHWHFSYLNQQACILLERTKEQLMGKNIWDEFPEAVNSQFYQEYQSVVQKKEACRFQACYPPLNKWFDVNAFPIPEGIAVYFRDLTQDREHQKQLRLVEAALSRQNDIVMITTADGIDAPSGPNIVFVNDAFERITGYTKSEAIGNTPRMLQGPSTEREKLDDVRQALEKKQPIRCELLNYTKNGALYWLELDITPLFDDEGRCTHFVAVERDITQRKQQEAELRKAQERFELLSKATNDVIWDWDLASGQVWWNNAITQVFGFEPSELEPGAESWTSRIHPDDFEDVYESIYDVIEGTEEFWDAEYRFIKRNGDYAKVIDRGFVIRDDNDKALRMVGSMIDITQRMDMEQQLRESQKLEAVGHLTGGVAHDFNNLLTVILGNTEMLVELEMNPQLRPMAEMTFSAAKRGAELTSRLLAFARRQPLDPKPIKINQLVESMLALVRRTLPENIELEFIPHTDLGIIEIDAGELDTALLNLVINARDAMQKGGKLTIETDNVVLDSDYAARHPEVVAGEYVLICITDTGGGMTQEVIRRAFEPFFTTKSVGKGSGLGLSMVFGFTKQSGGHIKIYSEVGEGTSIKLYFPRICERKFIMEQHIVAAEPERGTEHILIAEDDDLVLKHLETQLRSLGYRVSAVTSGPEALGVLRAQSDIDMLLTDIIMPGGMNGRELADLAQSEFPLLKVLFTSGYTENAIDHQGRLDPGVKLLSKPYTRLKLATKVRKVLDQVSKG